MIVEDDQGREGVRFSQLKRIGQSAAHYNYYRGRGMGERRDLRVGTAIHALVLGGPDIAVFPGKVRNGKAWDAFKAENEDKLILSNSEHYAANGAADSILANTDAIRLLGGIHERELKHWTHLGRKCGGRPDVVNAHWVSELKTTHTAHPFRFPHLGLRLAYHAQLAWYLHGNREGGGTAKDAFIVAVETTPPFVVTPFQVTARALEAGTRQWMLWMEQMVACEEAGQWPAYTQTIAEFDVPDTDDVALVFGDEEGEEEAA